MMRLIFALILTGFLSFASYAQVSINNDNSVPDSSAMLDIKSTTKGVLVPRMTASQRDAIPNPAKGLMIFCTDNNQYYTNAGTPSSRNWIMMNSQWITNGSSIYYNDGNVGVGTASPSTLFEVAGITKIHSLSGPTLLGLQTQTEHDFTQLLLLDYSDSYTGYLGYIEAEAPYGIRDNTIELGSSSADITIRPAENETMRLTGAGNVGIGTSTPNPAAKLDISSSEKGVLIPRMTNEEIIAFGDSLGATDKGMIVFNIDDIKLEYWDGTAWKTMVTKTTTAGSGSDGTGSCTEGVTDHDGHTYKTVQIGDQCWMAENLKSTHYSNGSAITEAWAYNNDEGLAHTYGRLYTWAAMMHGATYSSSNPSGVQGVCPNGWHLPSDDEWKELEMTLGMTTDEVNGNSWRGSHSEGRKLKESEAAFLWQTSSTSGNNNSGFTALPGGYNYGQSFSDLGTGAYFWSCTEFYPTSAFYRVLLSGHADVFRTQVNKFDGYSVRCLKD
jgi:uncharacterized protein (TIGR02145 family)